MVNAAKVAVTIDAAILDATEKLRKRTGESRSAVVTRALRQLVASEKRRAQVAEYVEAYTVHPETDVEIESAAALAKTALRGLVW